MPERRSALEGAVAGGPVGVRELPRSVIQVSAFHGRADATAVALGDRLGIEAPVRSGDAAEADGLAVLCVGPGRWWLIGERALAAPDLDLSLCAVVDQGHGRVVFEVEGDCVRELLAKGTSVDLHPSALPAGRCAATALGHVAVVLHARARDRFEIHVSRSYARALFEWLEDAAHEFEPVPAG